MVNDCENCLSGDHALCDGGTWNSEAMPVVCDCYVDGHNPYAEGGTSLFDVSIFEGPEIP
jgi:hypothetical protein